MKKIINKKNAMGNPENYPKKHLKTDLYLRNKQKKKFLTIN